MSEKPILFSTPMVQAIREGRKTVTRRVMRKQPPNDYHYRGQANNRFLDRADHRFSHGYARWYAKCPYGIPGDTLWVRETWGVSVGHTQRFKPGTILYRADHGRDVGGQELDLIKWRPSIHMPRWAARLFLTVKGVRAERIQEISHEDAISEGYAEGIEPNNYGTGSQARDWLAELWDTINAKRGYPWESNPWVWRIEFEVKT